MAKSCVLFSLRNIDALPAMLAQIQQWDEVKAAGTLFPGSSDKDLQRMGFVELNDEANVQNVVERVSALPEVEKASLAARRQLT